MANPNPPVLLTPANSSKVIGNVLIFTFTIPTDSDNDKLVFRVEMDTNNPIDSGSLDYKKYESRLIANENQGRWEIKDGSNYIPMPSGGVSSTYYGNEAKVYIRQQEVYSYPSLNGTWYWRVSASDNIGLHPLFNQAIFAQVIFG